MKPSQITKFFPAMIAIVLSCLISACGGSANSSPDASYMNVALGAESPAEITGTSSAIIAANMVTKVELVNSNASNEAQTNVPITFGQVFRPGEIPKAEGVFLSLEDGTGVPF